MSDTFDNIFGRARNDLAAVDEPAAVATVPQEAADPGRADDGGAHETATDGTTTDGVAEHAEVEDSEADDDTGAEVLDEAGVVAEDAVTVVPVTVEPGDLPAESGDAAAESGDVEPERAEPAAVADAAAPAEPEQAVEARPAAGTRGNTTVGDGVVSRVVTTVAGKVEGVHRLDDEDSSVTVDADVATIRIALVIVDGHPVRALAERMRIAVIDAVEEFLGLDVAGVDVHVSDIHYPESV